MRHQILEHRQLRRPRVHAAGGPDAALLLSAVEAGRELLRTPFQHQGRLAGVGVDCIGVLEHVAGRTGALVEDFRAYRIPAPFEQLLHHLERNLDPVPVEEAEPGHFLAIAIEDRDDQSTRYGHVALRTDYGILHAVWSAVRVGEHRLTPPWERRIHSAWRLRWPR